MRSMEPASHPAVRPAPWPLLVALALLLASLALFWPGIASYDSVTQYQQLLSGHYDDWHPPVMARLWSLLMGARLGAWPMLLLQVAGYWLGLGLVARALGGWRAGLVLVIGLLPPLLGWQGVIVKDSQMVAALLLATGLVANARLRGRPMSRPALVLVALCLLYATLIRVNAAFSTVPLIVLLLPRRWTPVPAIATMLAGIALVLVLSGPINHGLMRAQDSGVRRSAPIYDLAGIAVRSDDAAATGIAPAAIAALRTHQCVRPLFWDPMSETPYCEKPVAPLFHRPVGTLYADLARSALRHPVAYLGHRLAHLNSTGRWLVALHWPLASPPFEAEPNDVGLGSPACCGAKLWQRLAGWACETPLGWPVCWLVAMLWGLWALARRAQGPRERLALALFASALVQEASFSAISLSSDLRYHLWPIAATAIGWALIAGPPARGSRRAAIMAGVLALVIASGLYARATLPEPPADYRALLL